MTSFAMKPEITAPGVNITGARAAGTTLSTPIDAHYVVASGTSFAAPEVAGAAAILAATHPGWSPVRLKADLISTAHRVSTRLAAAESTSARVVYPLGDRERITGTFPTYRV